MKRTYLLAFLLPGLAVAAESGESAFNRACSSCHMVKPIDSSAKGAKGARVTKSSPDTPRTNLVELMQARTPEQLLTWVQSPQKVNPKTACDTRLLGTTSPETVLDYVVSSMETPAPTRKELLRQERERNRAELRALRQRKGKKAPAAPSAPSTTTQGKK